MRSGYCCTCDTIALVSTVKCSSWCLSYSFELYGTQVLIPPPPPQTQLAIDGAPLSAFVGGGSAGTGAKASPRGDDADAYVNRVPNNRIPFTGRVSLSRCSGVTPGRSREGRLGWLWVSRSEAGALPLFCFGVLRGRRWTESRRLLVACFWVPSRRCGGSAQRTDYTHVLSRDGGLSFYDTECVTWEALPLSGPSTMQLWRRADTRHGDSLKAYQTIPTKRV